MSALGKVLRTLHRFSGNPAIWTANSGGRPQARKNLTRRGRVALLVMFWMIPLAAIATPVETDKLTVEIAPEPTTQPVKLLVKYAACYLWSDPILEVHEEDFSVDISLHPEKSGFLCNSPFTDELLVEVQQFGTYAFNIYEQEYAEGLVGFDPKNYIGSFDVTVGSVSDSYYITVAPDSPSTSDLVYVHFDKLDGAPCDLDFNGVLVDSARKQVKVSVEPISGTLPDCAAPDSFRFLIGRLDKSASYGFRVYEEVPSDSTPLFSEENLAASFTLTSGESAKGFSAETPAPGSVQSGVGIVRGWVCEARRVEIQFDDEDLIEVAYGSSRADTADACGDSSNGYGMVMNWSLLEPGLHTMTTYIDGVERQTVAFEVTGLGEEFVTGLQGTYTLEDFPGPGESVTVQWDEALQNFIIVDHVQ